ncbi:MAG: hypothetical protein KKC51_00600 [Verrucomicrobia bacterium]|nr:hypothetical protein [Verrucomicrobiota bacterium]
MQENQGGGDQWLAQVVDKAAADYKSEREQEERAARRRERNHRVFRQFLVFLLFLGMAAGFIFRNELGQFLLKIDGTLFRAKTQGKKSPGPVQKTVRKIRFISDEADKRIDTLDEIQR